MFCDELKIKVVAGRGGNGCLSFRREKFVPKGGPDGGDGGNGGDIIIRVNSNLNTLGHMAHQKIFKATSGVAGKGKKMHGKNGENLIIEVPIGTIIFNEDKSKEIADLNTENNQVVIAQGGKGGLGNARFVSSTHQAPRFAEMGEPGEEKGITLELKLVADLGIIGLPSAGKSTLISVISNAKPKIAAYHFTTLSPNLGLVDPSRFGGSATQSFIAADIPGLIEGASQGKGLGHQFLKHISRTKLLVHLIDGSLESPEQNYKTINQELKAFDKQLAKLKQIIVINKSDIIDEEILKDTSSKLKKASKQANIFKISALTQTNLKELIFEIIKKLEAIRKAEISKKKKPVKIAIPVLRPDQDKIKFQVEKVVKKTDHKEFRITGHRIEQLVVMTDLKNLEGLERVYRYLDSTGIKRAIEQKGASFGDTIKVGEKKFPYRK